MTKIVLKCPSCGHMIDFGPNWVPVDVSTPLRNADRIRAMTDEELADWASAISLEEFGDKKDWLDWLRQEGENGKTD